VVKALVALLVPVVASCGQPTGEVSSGTRKTPSYTGTTASTTTSTLPSYASGAMPTTSGLAPGTPVLLCGDRGAGRDVRVTGTTCDDGEFLVGAQARACRASGPCDFHARAFDCRVEPAERAVHRYVCTAAGRVVRFSVAAPPPQAP